MLNSQTLFRNFRKKLHQWDLMEFYREIPWYCLNFIIREWFSSHTYWKMGKVCQSFWRIAHNIVLFWIEKSERLIGEEGVFTIFHYYYTDNSSSRLYFTPFTPAFHLVWLGQTSSVDHIVCIYYTEKEKKLSWFRNFSVFVSELWEATQEV